MMSLDAGVRELGLVPAADCFDRLRVYLDLLERWNRVYNLTAVPMEQAVTHHLLDSLAIAPHVGTPGTLIDIGSGAGLPGVPLAVLLADTRVTLLDSNGKKTRFLEQVRVALGLDNVEVVRSRAEDMTGRFDVVTSRAFASLAEFSRLTAHLLSSCGRALAMKGALDRQELDEDPSPLVVARVIPLTVPGIAAERHLVELRRPETSPEE